MTATGTTQTSVVIPLLMAKVVAVMVTEWRKFIADLESEMWHVVVAAVMPTEARASMHL